MGALCLWGGEIAARPPARPRRAAHTGHRRQSGAGSHCAQTNPHARPYSHTCTPVNTHRILPVGCLSLALICAPVLRVCWLRTRVLCGKAKGLRSLQRAVVQNAIPQPTKCRSGQTPPASICEYRRGDERRNAPPPNCSCNPAMVPRFQVAVSGNPSDAHTAHRVLIT